MNEAETILFDGNKFDFFLSLEVTDEIITLLHEPMSSTSSALRRTRGVPPTSDQQKKPIAKQSTIRTNKIVNGIHLSIAASYNQENGKLEIKAEANRDKKNYKVSYIASNGEKVGIDSAEIPPTMSNILMFLLDPEGAEKPCACGRLAVRQDGQSISPSILVDEMDEYERILLTENSWNDYKNKQIRRKADLPGMVCSDSSPMNKVIEDIKFAEKTKVPVLVLAESGAGKESVADALHKLRNRTGKLIKVNCSVLAAGDPMLVLSKLFGIGEGHGLPNVPKEGQPGLLMEANEGTLFLDEIADLPLGTQINLLRVLDGYEFYPAVGKGGPRCTTARFVGATNKDLQLELRNGTLRRDFHERWKTLSIKVPPLRQRFQDIPALVEYFTIKHGTVTFAKDIFQALFWYDWPGNVRELERLCLSTLKESLPEIKALDLNAFINLPLDKELQVALKRADEKYQAAVKRSEIKEPEKEIIDQLAEISVKLFPAALAALEMEDRTAWEKKIATAQKEFKEFLVQMNPDCENSLHELIDCFAMLRACYPPKHPLPKKILRLVLEYLKQHKATLSNKKEKVPYETFLKFFGQTHDVARKWKV